MMTFILDDDLVKSFKLFDNRRLGKQRVEAHQIINAIEGRSKGWTSHPITKAWSKHTDALKVYFNLCVIEWEERGYKNSMAMYDVPMDGSVIFPWWVVNLPVIYSHQASMLRKEPYFYTKLISPPEKYVNAGYLWPNDDVYKKLQAGIDPILLCAPIMGRNVNAKFCDALIKSGKRKGECCGNLLHIGQIFCGVHKK
jgi:hypothetical protein